MNRVSSYVLSIILLTATFYFGVMSGETQAQEQDDTELTYELLTLHIMPHYVEPEEWDKDHPAILTGIHGTLLNESETLVESDIHIPVPIDWYGFQFASAGEVADGEIINEVEAIVDEDAGTVILQPENGIAPGENYHFVLEYYSAMSNTDSPFEFNYVYELERHAHTMNILFFEPYGAEDFTMSADADMETEMFDIPVHAYIMGAMNPGQVLDVSFTYEKTDNKTTLEALATGESTGNETIPEELANPEQPMNQIETVVMIMITIVIIGLFVFFGWKGRKKRKKNQEHVPTDQSDIDINHLQKKLIRGEIDKETYEKEIKKRTS